MRYHGPKTERQRTKDRRRERKLNSTGASPFSRAASKAHTYASEPPHKEEQSKTTLPVQQVGRKPGVKQRFGRQ